jgi:hypothetical protein
MKNKTMTGLLFAVVFTASFAAETQAGLWNKVTSLAFWKRQWPETLIVTGNYAKPRLLAEQAQKKTDLPIILVSEEAGGNEVYYLPEKPEALRIAEGRFLEFVEVMVRPQRVVVLGDTNYVPEMYVSKLRERYPTIVLSGDDWIETAQELGKIIGYRRLPKHYRANLKQLLEAEAHSTEAAVDMSTFMAE